MEDGTTPEPEHAEESTDARPEDIDERSDRPGLGATLTRAADIILEASRAYQVGLDDCSSMTDENFERQALECVRALMLAGWSAPDERTIGIPNGLMLHESQWQGLINGQDAWIITPGGEWALQLTVHTGQAPPSASVREQLWKLREDANDPTRGSSTWDEHGQRDVTVPRSFLTFLVQLAVEFRRTGDYAAANSLDNTLAGIAAELRAAGIAWSDGGGATPASAPPVKSNDKLARLHRDIITVLRYVSGGFSYGSPATYPDVQARRALGTIELQDAPVGAETHGQPLPWWSPLRVTTGAPGVPDTSPRRKTVTVDNYAIQSRSTPSDSTDIKPVQDMTIGEAKQLIADFWAAYPHPSWVGTEPNTVVHQRSPEDYFRSPERIDELEHRLGRRIESCGRVRDELFKIVAEHPLTHDEFTGIEPDSVCVGYVAQQAGRLLRWYEGELTRATTEGTPGLVHQVDRAFHRLALRERDHAWVESANRKRRIEELEAELEQLRAQLELNQPKYSALTWAKMEGIRLTNYHGWDREQRDIKTPITRTQFLELAELCKYVVLEGLEPDDSRGEAQT